MKNFELTHSLTPTSGMYLGNDPVLPPSQLEMDAIEEQAINSFLASYKHRVHSKATEYVDTMEETTRIQYSRKRTPYWYVTINPKPEITIATLHNQIVELLSRPEIIDPLWCYEIRKEPDVGLHAHILFTCHTNDVNFTNRKVKNPFVPQICGTKKHVHVRWITLDEIETVKSYIRKTTVSTKKKPSDSATQAWRLANNIRKEYTEDHLLVWSSLSTDDTIIYLN